MLTKNQIFNKIKIYPRLKGIFIFSEKTKKRES